MQELPRSLLDRLAAVRSAGVITGAGLSAESGIRTYRGAGGIYDDPVEGARTVEALSGPTLARDPDRTWRALAGLARQAHDARPNAGHHALVRMERMLARFVLLTQNVDGLHQLAGSQEVIDIHGSIFRTLCTACGRGGRLERADLEALDRAPRCPACGGVLRPDAVLFGEMLPEDKVARLHERFYVDAPDLVLIAGTTAVFPYIQEPVLVARTRRSLTVEVNPEPTELSAVVDFSLRAPAGVALPLLADGLGAERPLA